MDEPVYVGKGTFDDLLEKSMLQIFQYLPLKERIRNSRVSRNWLSVLSQLRESQETLVIGQCDFDNATYLELSICNVHPQHSETVSDTIVNIDDIALGKLLRSLKNLKSIFINAPIKMRLSDISETIEHIHFGHAMKDVITFDKKNFSQLKCITMSNMYGTEFFLDGITNLLTNHQLQLENVSVSEIQMFPCELIIQMPNLKQVRTIDAENKLDCFCKKHKLAIMDALPRLQYYSFSLFYWSDYDEACPMKWIVEFGSPTQVLTRKFFIDAYTNFTIGNVLELTKDIVHGLHVAVDNETTQLNYMATMNALKNLRLVFSPLTNETIISSIQHFLNIAPNLRYIHLRFPRNDVFQEAELLNSMLNEVYSFALNNPKRSVAFTLSGIGEPNDAFSDSRLPTNLAVSFLPIKINFF